ncbi:hypothetical protein K443DRAFT_254235 [Laccaria amethystina LaAM-08-1]|uniref:Uncharacterized protein n=1 Tax=Laccaria amethystina LaAM-08-1 TaxID=1095629 RepID=A0A0C9XMM6_9AGAR|nr:hypothetical protein K443DRAFT_254235 [Laccaria amethystina LaAM-08-1]
MDNCKKELPDTPSSYTHPRGIGAYASTVTLLPEQGVALPSPSSACTGFSTSPVPGKVRRTSGCKFMNTWGDKWKLRLMVHFWLCVVIEESRILGQTPKPLLSIPVHAHILSDQQRSLHRPQWPSPSESVPSAISECCSSLYLTCTSRPWSLPINEAPSSKPYHLKRSTVKRSTPRHHRRGSSIPTVYPSPMVSSIALQRNSLRSQRTIPHIIGWDSAQLFGKARHLVAMQHYQVLR